MEGLRLRAAVRPLPPPPQTSPLLPPSLSLSPLSFAADAAVEFLQNLLQLTAASAAAAAAAAAGSPKLEEKEETDGRDTAAKAAAQLKTRAINGYNNVTPRVA